MGKTTFSGPVAGAYMSFETTAGTGTATKDLSGLIPTGMIFRLFSVSTFQRTGGSCALILGITGTTQGYMTTLSFSPDVAGHSIVDGTLTTDGTVDLTGGDEILANFSGTLTDPTQITLHGYVIGHTTDLDREGA